MILNSFITTTTLAGFFGMAAHAAVLTFEIDGLANFDEINQGYGDRITATTVGAFSYGADEGVTPNVTVDYGDSDPSLWTTGFGSLTNVLFENEDSTGVLTVTISADPGYEVRLHEFDLSAFGSVFSSDPTVDLVAVVGLTGALFSEVDASVSETTFTKYDFSPTLQASELTVVIDARNLDDLNDDIAIDNIVFSQVAVPEPSSAIFFLMSGFILIRRRR